jgi:long-chain acyl-CoA synthetase
VLTEYVNRMPEELLVRPFIFNADQAISIRGILDHPTSHLEKIQKGDVVALIGDFDSLTLANFFTLIQIGTVIVPLTQKTSSQHDYFFKAAHVDWIVEKDSITRLTSSIELKNKALESFKQTHKSGLILFTSGTSQVPKAILHDLNLLLSRFSITRKPLKSLGFLLFDHIGGLNTFFHVLFNRGQLVSTTERDPSHIVELIKRHEIELLPTTPTFLRMLLIAGYSQNDFPDSLKLITYGTEKFDEGTLNQLVRKFPKVNFRQTYGMTELGILSVKSERNDSLFFKIGGEGVETKIVNNILHIRSKYRMIGYLNADSPFDSDGWYNTKDVVEQKGEYIRIIGRNNDLINVGGLKFFPSEVENVLLKYEGVKFVNVTAKKNPITGEHVEVTIEPTQNTSFQMEDFEIFIKTNLQKHMQPLKISLGGVEIGNRFKRI